MCIKPYASFIHKCTCTPYTQISNTHKYRHICIHMHTLIHITHMYTNIKFEKKSECTFLGTTTEAFLICIYIHMHAFYKQIHTQIHTCTLNETG